MGLGVAGDVTLGATTGKGGIETRDGGTLAGRTAESGAGVVAPVESAMSAVGQFERLTPPAPGFAVTGVWFDGDFNLRPSSAEAGATAAAGFADVAGRTGAGVTSCDGDGGRVGPGTG
jgi:hypothetical protein